MSEVSKWEPQDEIESGGGPVKPKKKVTAETALKRAAREFMSLYKIWTFPITAGIGSHPGLPDRMGIYQGKPLAIEFKGPGGRLSPYQKEFKEQFEREGGLYILCKSLEDLAAGFGIKVLFGA